MALPLVAGTQFVGDQAEGYGPRDGLVVISGGGEVQRMGQTSLGVEPAIALLGQFGDRMLREESRLAELGGGVVREGLGAVLAELQGVVLLAGGVGPRAAWTIKAIDLIDVPPGVEDAHWTQLAERNT